HRKAVAGKADVERVAHRAVRAVAANHVAKLGAFGPAVRPLELDTNATSVVTQARELEPALDVHALVRQMLGEDALGHVLRNAKIAVGQVREILQRLMRLARDDGAQAAQPYACVDHRARYPHVLPDLERARRDTDRLAIAGRRRKL